MLKGNYVSTMKEHELGRFSQISLYISIVCGAMQAKNDSPSNTKGCRSFIVSLSMASMFFHQHNLVCGRDYLSLLSVSSCFKFRC